MIQILSDTCSKWNVNLHLLAPAWNKLDCPVPVNPSSQRGVVSVSCNSGKDKVKSSWSLSPEIENIQISALTEQEWTWGPLSGYQPGVWQGLSSAPFLKTSWNEHIALFMFWSCQNMVHEITFSSRISWKALPVLEGVCKGLQANLMSSLEVCCCFSAYYFLIFSHLPKMLFAGSLYPPVKFSLQKSESCPFQL